MDMQPQRQQQVQAQVPSTAQERLFDCAVRIMRERLLTPLRFGRSDELVVITWTQGASGRLVGDFARWYVVGFLGGRMRGEPGLLIVDEVSCFFADVVDGLEG
jgi:hypothetical protein